MATAKVGWTPDLESAERSAKYARMDEASARAYLEKRTNELRAREAALYRIEYAGPIELTLSREESDALIAVLRIDRGPVAGERRGLTDGVLLALQAATGVDRDLDLEDVSGSRIIFG